MQEVYNLIRIDHGLKLYASNLIVINKSFFCNLLQFSEDEVQLLYHETVVRIIEFDKYFGDNEFVLSYDDRGKARVKVCLEQLPFKRAVNDAISSMRKAINSSVHICGLVILHIALCS